MIVRARPTRANLRVAAGMLCALLLCMGMPSTAFATDLAQQAPGQSDQPAPQTKQKLVLDHGHIDAFTPVVENGKLTLLLKEDVTALNTLRDPESVVMHVKKTALTNMASVPSPAGLSGNAYYLPLTQDHSLVWPGWETQLIGSDYPNANTNIVVSEVSGPGEVYLWTSGEFGSIRSLLLEGGYRLPATISQPYPAHTHAAWAFTKPGTYDFTVRADVTGSNGKSASTQTVTYTFVVGDLATQSTTTVASDTTVVDPGEPVTLTARVNPGAVGAVQFRELTSNSILGHTPVSGKGTATFVADALQSGNRSIVAEFVPTWNYGFAPSKSAAVAVTVSGEERAKPVGDATPVPESQIQATAPGGAVTITTPGKTIAAGGTLTLVLADPELAGTWVSVWIPGQSPAWQGWIQTDLNGRFSVSTATTIQTGSHRLVAKNEEGSFIGWDAFTVKAATSDDGGRKPGNTATTPTKPAVASTQSCAPAITLETGHIDAFYVSAANGKAVLQLMEDVTGYHVIREAETVLLKVKESAHASSIPAGTPGAPSGYVLPLTQNPALIWPGWDTNRTSASGYSDVSINITGVHGPGTVYLSSQGSFGEIKSLLNGGGYTLPGTIREHTPAHTHAQWVFSQKGIYKLTAHAVATNPATGKSLTTATHTYVFQVGDVPLGDAFCGLSSAGVADAIEVNTAVNKSSAEAVAASQAKAKKEKGSKQQQSARRANGADAKEQDGVLAALFGDEADPVVVSGIIVGGVLIVGGIAGATYWYLRRLREQNAELTPAVQGGE